MFLEIMVFLTLISGFIIVYKTYTSSPLQLLVVVKNNEDNLMLKSLDNNESYYIGN